MYTLNAKQPGNALQVSVGWLHVLLHLGTALTLVPAGTSPIYAAFMDVIREGQ